MERQILPSTTVVELLTKDNYDIWRVCMKSYLLSEDLWDVTNKKSKPPKREDDEVKFKDWEKKNAAALHAIQVSCSRFILSQIKDETLAKEAWDALAGKLGKKIIFVTEPVVSNNYTVLLKYVHKGNWDAAKIFITLNPSAVNAKLSPNGETALHMAALAGHLKIVEELVDLMSKEAMEITDCDGRTALYIAADVGNTEMVKCMIRKNNNLAAIADAQEILPVTVACLSNHPDTALYLYSVTPIEFLLLKNGYQGGQLLRSVIECHMFDIALDLLYRSANLALASGSNSLYVLSTMADAFHSGCRLSLWQQWIYSCINVKHPAKPNDVQIRIDAQIKNKPKNIMQQVLNQCHGLGNSILKLLGIKKLYELKMTHVYSIEILRLICQYLSTIDVNKYDDSGVIDAFNNAAMTGVVEFITEMTSIVYPELPTHNTDKYLRNIIMISVVHRQEKIYSLVHGIGEIKTSFFSQVDEFENNMLHLAGMLSPPSQLHRISGAALQMQRELQWYKEVESNMPPPFLQSQNQEDETPWQVFTKNHKNLAIEAEKWMKETATSSTVVAALIVTIMFTTAFTIPGGNVEETGLPKFLDKIPFTTFVISDAISLFASSTSVLMFLGILTSRYAEDDFLKSLPTKLIIGLSMLFISIAAMMIAFCATLIIMLDGQLRLVVPIVLLASVPVTLFWLLQFPLLLEIFKSTYGRSIFDRKMKRWY